MDIPTPETRPLLPATRDPDGFEAAAPTAEKAAALETPTRRAVVGWTLYDFGDTVFQQNIITNYFPVWVVAVMGGTDGQVSLINTITMGLMIGVGPWLGAVSDRLPRRVPVLMATAIGCCLLTFFLG